MCGGGGGVYDLDPALKKWLNYTLTFKHYPTLSPNTNRLGNFLSPRKFPYCSPSTNRLGILLSPGKFP